MITLEVNLARYESWLRAEIGSDLHSLEETLKSIEAANFPGAKHVMKRGMMITELNILPVEFFRQRAIHKCYKSIIGSLHDYLDKSIAILQVKKCETTLEIKATEEELIQSFNSLVERYVLAVATDRSLSPMKKVDKLLDEENYEDHKNALRGYFEVRNGLEHHKGVANKNKSLLYKRIGVASTAGNEVELGEPLGPGEGWVLKTFDEKIEYDAGGKLILEKGQLEDIVTGLVVFVVPVLQKSLERKFNGQASELEEF